MRARIEGVYGEMMTKLKTSAQITICITWLVVGLFCCHISAQEISITDQRLKQATEEAYDYSLVKPKQSLEILKANEGLLVGASDYYKFLYYRAGFWTAVYLYDLERISYFAQAMVETRNFPDSELVFHEVMNSLSLWYRVNQDYQSSLAAGRCSLEYAQTEKSLNRNSVSAGLSYLLLDDYAEARQIFAVNETTAIRLNNLIGIAAAKNNIGLLDLFINDYKAAEDKFRQALKINEEMNRAKGTALNLVNLLLSFYLQQDWDNFQRVLGRANRASMLLDNEDIKQYLFWLKTAYEIKQNNAKAKYEQALINSYKKVTEPSVLKLITVISDSLAINLPPQNAIEEKKLDFWQTFPVCKESPYLDLKISELLKLRAKQVQSGSVLNK